MYGITFFVCSKFWVSRCILVAISVIFFLTIRLESRAPCRKEVRRRFRMKALQQRKRSHVWCCASKGVRKSLHDVWDLWSIRRMPMKAKKSRERNHATGATRLKFKNRIFSSESTRENSPQASRKLVLESQNQTEKDERKYSNSKSSRKLAASSPELINMEYTNHRYMSKIFECLRKKLGMSAVNAPFSMEAYQTYVFMWWIFLTSSMKAAIHLGPNYLADSEIYKNTKCEETESLFIITQSRWKNIRKKFWTWNAWSIPHLPGRVGISHWSRDQMGEGKSMCLCWFRSMDRWRRVQKQ